MFDAVWTIGDSLGMKNSAGILVVIKFEKANDCVAHDFLFKVSEKFNFGSYFKQWIRTLYTDISSYVMNNGFSYKLSFVQSIGFFKVILSYLSFLLWT